MNLFPFIKSDIEEVHHITTYKEYEFDFHNNTLTGRLLEGKEALKMWIYKALLTKRYVYPIYSWVGYTLKSLVDGVVTSMFTSMMKEVVVPKKLHHGQV